MKSARPDLHVERLLQHAALTGPVVFQGEDQPLERLKVKIASRHRRGLRREGAREYSHSPSFGSAASGERGCRAHLNRRRPAAHCGRLTVLLSAEGG